MFIEKFFHRKNSPPGRSPALASAEPLRANGVYLALQRHLGHFRPLTLRPADTSLNFECMLLAIDTQRQQIRIDQPHPRPLTVAAGSLLDIELTLPRQHPAVYQSCILEVLEQNGNQNYVLSLPVLKQGGQRRRAFRLACHQSMPSFVGTGEQQQVPAVIEDISIYGVALRVLQEDASRLRRGKVLRNCCIDYAGLNLLCDIRIKRTVEDGAQTLVCGDFIHADKEGERSLERFTMQQQQRIAAMRLG